MKKIVFNRRFFIAIFEKFVIIILVGNFNATFSYLHFKDNDENSV